MQLSPRFAHQFFYYGDGPEYDAARVNFRWTLPSQGFRWGPPEWVLGAPSNGLSLKDDTEAGPAARLCCAATAAARANRLGSCLQLPGGNRARAQHRCCNCCQEGVLDDLLTHDHSPFERIVTEKLLHWTLPGWI